MRVENKIVVVKIHKDIEPTDPDMVLLGLMLESLGPLKYLPNT